MTSSAHMSQHIHQELVQVLYCHLFEFKLPPETRVTYVSLDHWDRIIVAVEWRHNISHK